MQRDIDFSRENGRENAWGRDGDETRDETAAATRSIGSLDVLAASGFVPIGANAVWVDGDEPLPMPSTSRPPMAENLDTIPARPIRQLIPPPNALQTSYASASEPATIPAAAQIADHRSLTGAQLLGLHLPTHPSHDDADFTTDTADDSARILEHRGPRVTWHSDNDWALSIGRLNFVDSRPSLNPSLNLRLEPPDSLLPPFRPTLGFQPPDSHGISAPPLTAECLDCLEGKPCSGCGSSVFHPATTQYAVTVGRLNLEPFTASALRFDVSAFPQMAYQVLPKRLSETAVGFPEKPDDMRGALQCVKCDGMTANRILTEISLLQYFAAQELYTYSQRGTIPPEVSKRINYYWNCIRYLKQCLQHVPTILSRSVIDEIREKLRNNKVQEVLKDIADKLGDNDIINLSRILEAEFPWIKEELENASRKSIPASQPTLISGQSRSSIFMYFYSYLTPCPLPWQVTVEEHISISFRTNPERSEVSSELQDIIILFGEKKEIFSKRIESRAQAIFPARINLFDFEQSSELAQRNANIIQDAISRIKNEYPDTDVLISVSVSYFAIFSCSDGSQFRSLIDYDEILYSALKSDTPPPEPEATPLPQTAAPQITINEKYPMREIEVERGDLSKLYDADNIPSELPCPSRRGLYKKVVVLRRNVSIDRNDWGLPNYPYRELDDTIELPKWMQDTSYDTRDIFRLDGYSHLFFQKMDLLFKELNEYVANEMAVGVERCLNLKSSGIISTHVLRQTHCEGSCVICWKTIGYLANFGRNISPLEFSDNRQTIKFSISVSIDIIIDIVCALK